MGITIAFSTKLICLWIIALNSLIIVHHSEDKKANKKVCGLSAILMVLVIM